MDSDTKHFLQSKTLWGLIVLFVGYLNKRFHWGLVADEQFAEDVTTGIGILLSAWGRITAKTSLTMTREDSARLWAIVGVLDFALVIVKGLCIALALAVLCTLSGCAFEDGFNVKGKVCYGPDGKQVCVTESGLEGHLKRGDVDATVEVPWLAPRSTSNAQRPTSNIQGAGAKATVPLEK